MKAASEFAPKVTCKVKVARVALALTVATVPFGAWADDDLLSILSEGEGAAASATGPNGTTAKTEKKPSLLKGVLEKPTAEQNIFMEFFDRGEMEKALYQWPVAFEGSEFAKSASGKALHAYLLHRNGIRVAGLESLLAIEKPEEIRPQVTQAWKDSVSETDDVWRFIVVPSWKAAWTETFGIAAEIRVRSRQSYGRDQLDQLKELLKKTQVDTRERAWLEWQLVLALADGSDSAVVGKALAHLMKAPNNPVSQDLLTVTAARLLFQNGFLDAAVKYYEKVPKSSDHWFDAQEEMAWAFIRKGEPQNAIAITQTLVAPPFTAQVGPEPIFLRALAQLKVCDYPEVIKTLNLYRDRFRDRARSLLDLSESADRPAVARLVDRLKKGSTRSIDLGSDARLLPRFVTRDQALAQAAATESALEKEGKLAGELYARSLTGGTAKVGFQAGLETFRKQMESRVQTARAATLARVKLLAEEEINEVSRMLQKLHIVEAEVLQQISMSGRVAEATAKGKGTVAKGSTGSKAQDTIWFPANEKETWFDELSNYRADVKKGCESVKR